MALKQGTTVHEGQLMRQAIADGKTWGQFAPMLQMCDMEFVKKNIWDKLMAEHISKLAPKPVPLPKPPPVGAKP